MKINKYTLSLIVFVCGAIVMTFELVGSRVLGPYYGTSIFVWTSLIGIILGSLSLGYYLGGEMADRNANMRTLSIIIFFSACFIVFTTIFKDIILLFSNNFLSNKIGLIFSSIILFCPASVLLGMVSPYVVKLSLKNLENSGKTVGQLYALSTMGSIFGTFLSGFYLISKFGTNRILIIISIVLVILSIIIFHKKEFSKNNFFSIFLIFFLLILFYKISVFSKNSHMIDVDTMYNRVWIYDYIDKNTNSPIRVMGINNENHSSMFLEKDDLVNEYTKYYHLIRYFNPGFKKVLMFGGAGYSFPKDFLKKYKDATIDVVEIDPKITELAYKYFNLNNNERLHIFHQDGRVFLNKNKNKYDAILGDAFGSHYSIPYQLTTKEAVLEKYNSLNNNGLVILNIISSVEGNSSKFLRAEYETYKEIFPQVYIFPVEDKMNTSLVQNIILVALKSNNKFSFKNNNDIEIDNFLKNLWIGEINNDVPVLTDDYAPVDNYIFNII